MRDRTQLVLAGTVALLALVALSRRRESRAAAAGAAAAVATGAVQTAPTDPLAAIRAVDLFDPMRAPERSTAPVVAGGRITGHYLDPRTPTHLHRGVDIAAPRGTPVRALRGGVVVELSPDGRRRGYGNAALVEHPDGTAAFYAHLDDFADVRVGERIGVSTVVGYVGSTQAPRGPMQMKPHLHLEVFESIKRGWGGRAIINEDNPPRFDPELYADAYSVPLTGRA